jgi:hypothetical protein
MPDRIANIIVLGEDVARQDPKRHVETWIHALVGLSVDEQTDYKKAPYTQPSRQ